MNLLSGETGREPNPVECRCGRRWRYEWYAPLQGRYPPRWCHPKVNPCEECATTQHAPDVASAEAEERAARDRLRDARIPRPLWWVTLPPPRDSGLPPVAQVAIQAKDETEEGFQGRLRGLGDEWFGLLRCNVPALKAVWEWTPPRWLVLEGPVGTGKTTWLAGLARRLLTRPNDVWECTSGDNLPLPGERTLRRRRLRTLEYHAVDEIVDREGRKMRGLDPAPTRDVARVDLLFLDEVGAREKPNQLEVDTVARILTYRADHGLPTVVATNRPWRDLTHATAPLYGHPAADRLRSAVRVVLGGRSWRTS